MESTIIKKKTETFLNKENFLLQNTIFPKITPSSYVFLPAVQKGQYKTLIRKFNENNITYLLYCTTSSKLEVRDTTEGEPPVNKS